MKARLDTLNPRQKAVFARALYGRIRLKDNAATRFLLARLAKGGTR